MTSFLRLALVAFVALAPLSACDQTDDLTSGSEAQLLENARVARTSGDYATALRVLDAAREAYPESAAVRVEYAVTLLDRDDVNLLDLDRVARFLADDVPAPVAPVAPSPTLSVGPNTCPYAQDPTAVVFDPTSYEGFPQLEADAEVIAQTLALLDPVIPDAIQSFSLCTSVSDGPDGPALHYAPAEALAEMRALGLGDEQIAAALAANALARFLNAYLTVATSLTQQTTWYRFDGGVGVCAADPGLLQAEAEASVEDLGEAVFSLDLRGTALGSPVLTQDLVDLLLEGYTEIRDGIGRYCTTS